MKKLGKKFRKTANTVEAFDMGCACHNPCQCYCGAGAWSAIKTLHNDDDQLSVKNFR